MPSLCLPSRFVSVIYDVVSKLDELIGGWTASGESFESRDSARFCSEVLAKYFRHANMASFSRQLNLYGFTKVRSNREANEFRHDLFKRGYPELLSMLKRKRQLPVLQEEENETLIEVFFLREEVHRLNGVVCQLMKTQQMLLDEQRVLRAAAQQLNDENLIDFESLFS